MTTNLFRHLLTGRQAWRFPGLMLLLERKPGADTQELGIAFAEDLAYSHSPAEAVATLVRAAAYERAEQVVVDLEEAGIVETDWASTELNRIGDAQQATLEQFRIRCRGILARCQRAGIPRPEELEDLEAFLVSGSVLEESLAEIDKSLITAEAHQKHNVRRLVRELGIVAGSPRWVEVEELIMRGEYVLAQRAARRPVADIYYEIPRLNDQPWLNRSQSLETILHGFEDDAARPAARGRFIPAPTDKAGLELLESLRKIQRQTDDAIGAYAKAVQSLIGRPRQPRLEQDGRVWYTHLEFEDDHRLPRLVFNADREPLRFAVGDERGEADFRLALQVSADASDHVVVDIAAVLTLLAESPAGTRDRADRRILLLRSMCMQMPVRRIVDAASFGRDHETMRGRLWWLWYMTGYSVESYLVDVLLDLSGYNGAVLVALTDLTVEHARDSSQGLSVAALRDNPELPTRVLDAVEADLGDPHAVLVLLCVLEHSLIEIEPLYYALQKLLTTAGMTEHPRFVVQVPHALAVLCDKGYLRRTADGFELGSVGALRLVYRHDLAGRVDSSLTAVRDQFRQSRAAIARERIATDLNEVLAHATKKLIFRGIEGADPSHADLAKCCHAAFEHTQTVWPSVRATQYITIQSGLEYPIPPGNLWGCIVNLLNNAMEAATGSTASRVWFTVKAVDEGIELTVADSGGGFDRETLRILREGGQPQSGKRDGLGDGLVTVDVTATELGGRLVIDDDPHPDLGGASVRLILPMPGS